jgi:microcystin-dependent protein
MANKLPQGAVAPFFNNLNCFIYGRYARANHHVCQSQILSIAQNTALFSLLGTTYGGNGQTTFALPDFRGRVPVGTGQGPGLPSVDLGEMAGLPTTTLLIANMPAHNHTATVRVAVSDANASTTEGDGNILGAPAANIFAPANSASGNMGGTTATIGVAGGSQPFNNMQPYIGMNFVVCMEGIYPSRN